MTQTLGVTKVSEDIEGCNDMQTSAKLNQHLYKEENKRTRADKNKNDT